MTKHSRFLAHAALLAALYASLCWLQNLLLPGSASWAIQFRVAEALCVLALYTPAAIPGLSIGCLLFNLTFSAALPLDFLIGTAATYLSVQSMYLLRRVRIISLPLAALTMPALWNGLLIGWELSVYIGGGFWLNALYVAIGELAVLFVLGTALHYAISARGLDRRLFG